ncbi:MAG: DUF839 domain-containing protein [Thiohalophilus sp.]|jgi:hypothetical protein
MFKQSTNLYSWMTDVALLSLVITPVVAVLNINLAHADQDGYGKDFGVKVENLLEARSNQLFGIHKPLQKSAPATSGDYRSMGQSADDQVLLARGLRAEYLTREAGDKTDMMVFWPSEANPTHIVSCVEGGRETIAPGKLNPSVQTINLQNGNVRTVLRGMDRCDGIRLTDWGTVLVTEETDDGGAYEILDPMAFENATLVSRGTSNVVDSFGIPVTEQVAYRDALPTMAWEGLTVLDSGVVIGGDELRPGSGALDSDGGAIYKFVPSVPRTGNGKITDLSDSPLTAGNVFAMTVSCRDKGSSSFPQYGQGCEVGHSAWVRVIPANARIDANAKGATGYYRPEDLHSDPTYEDDGVRFCWTNTGNEGAHHYAEVVCGIDTNPIGSNSLKVNGNNALEYLADESEDRGYAVTTVNRFVEGDTDFNSFDNLAFQPHSGNLYVIEDHPNGDIFACLPDGADRNIKTDGCVKILSVKDSSAEPTGFMFSADGRTAYVSIQHSQDGLMPQVDDYATDDVLKISGFRSPRHPRYHSKHD